MPRRARLAAIAVFGLIGFGSAMAISAGANDVRACISERSGNVRPAGPTGMCSAAEITAKISADLFKSAKNGTVTIHGVAFKRGRNRGITINGNSFRNGTLPNTLTINGNSFRHGTLPNSLTINGNSFRTGTLPNSLTINGNSFRTGTLPNSLTINGTSFRSSGNTLTINGTEFGPGAAQGAKGDPPARPARAGPAGVVAGPPVTEVASPIHVASGATGKLASVEFTTTEPARVMVVGGFDTRLQPLRRRHLAARHAALADQPRGLFGAAGVARLVTASETAESARGQRQRAHHVPNTCGPCTISLSLVMPPSGAGFELQRGCRTRIRAGVFTLK